MRHHLFILVLIMFAYTACKTPEATGPRPKDADALFTMDEAQAQFWKDWKPAQNAPTQPELTTTLRAFDYWQVDDSIAVKSAWHHLFPVLDTLRGQRNVTAPVMQTLQVLLATLEPDTKNQTRLDATFVVENIKDPRWEGILCRFYKTLKEGGATPAFSILFVRVKSSGERPSIAMMWGASGFEKGEPWTARLERKKSGTTLSWDRGLKRMEKALAQSTKGPEADLMFTLLERAFWAPLAHEQYLASPWKKAKKPWKLPSSFPAAAGLKLQDRDVFQVLSDTAFVPNSEFEFKKPDAAQ